MNPNLLSKLAQLTDGSICRLDGVDELPPSWHLWKQTEIDAITIALASQRPLLVRGEPGTGKSQLARAAASALGWQLHCATLHARSEAQDLLYQFDAVRRLADAQVKKELEENAYWQPQALWRALDWHSAQTFGSLRAQAATTAPAGHVVLIDEIDKAASDVPNGLLEVLGARYFEIPALALRVPQKAQQHAWPLVIITTNEERDLPAAFMRRCMVLTHDAEQEGYGAFLLKHGHAHFGPGREAAENFIAEPVLQEAARQLVADRQNAKQAQLVAPGLAEYLDLLYALHALAPDDSDKQLQLLAQLSQYAFLKNRIEAGEDVRLRQTADGKRKAEAR